MQVSKSSLLVCKYLSLHADVTFHKGMCLELDTVLIMSVADTLVALYPSYITVMHVKVIHRVMHIISNVAQHCDHRNAAQGQLENRPN